MKIALITDTHFGARNDNSTIQSYMNKFYDDLFFPYLEEHNIKTIIHLGDLVDKRKSISYLTLKNLQEKFINPASQLGIESHIIVGNHDCYYRNTNQVNSVQELFGTSSEIKVYESAETVSFDGCKILLCPWISHDVRDDALDELENTDALIVMGHLEVNGFTMHSNIVCEHGFSKELFRKFDMVFSGHFHEKNDNSHIFYLGTPYEMMWTDCEQNKGFHIFDTETLELEYVKNPNRLFYKLHYNDHGVEELDELMIDFSPFENCYIKVIVEEKNNPFYLDKYLEKLNRSNPANLTVLDSNPDWSLYEDDFVDEAQDTLSILEKYVEGMELDVEKYKLNSILRGIYTEANEIR